MVTNRYLICLTVDNRAIPALRMHRKAARPIISEGARSRQGNAPSRLMGRTAERRGAYESGVQSEVQVGCGRAAVFFPHQRVAVRRRHQPACGVASHDAKRPRTPSRRVRRLLEDWLVRRRLERGPGLSARGVLRARVLCAANSVGGMRRGAQGDSRLRESRQIDADGSSRGAGRFARAAAAQKDCDRGARASPRAFFAFA